MTPLTEWYLPPGGPGLARAARRDTEVGRRTMSPRRRPMVQRPLSRALPEPVQRGRPAPKVPPEACSVKASAAGGRVS